MSEPDSKTFDCVQSMRQIRDGISAEIADIFRDHGSAWRQANRGSVSLGQLKVMSAIESCRTAALGGHVARCENDACGHTHVAYNSCLMGKAGNGELATT